MADDDLLLDASDLADIFGADDAKAGEDLAKSIEDLFLSSQRIDPKTDGRPDPRPDVRENASQLGNLLTDFDFSQQPLKPLILPIHPTPGPASQP